MLIRRSPYREYVRSVSYCIWNAPYWFKLNVVVLNDAIFTSRKIVNYTTFILLPYFLYNCHRFKFHCRIPYPQSIPPNPHPMQLTTGFVYQHPPYPSKPLEKRLECAPFLAIIFPRIRFDYNRQYHHAIRRQAAV